MFEVFDTIIIVGLGMAIWWFSGIFFMKNSRNGFDFAKISWVPLLASS